MFSRGKARRFQFILPGNLTTSHVMIVAKIRAPHLEKEAATEFVRLNCSLGLDFLATPSLGNAKKVFVLNIGE